MPKRMSEVPVEDTKPSNFWAVMLWVAFIVPMIFVWISIQSVPLIVGLLLIRLGIMAYPMVFKPKQPVEKPTAQKTADTKPQPIPLKPVAAPRSDILKPFKEELSAEWKGLMKLLRVYDHDAENKYLDDYRRLRGWK